MSGEEADQLRLAVVAALVDLDWPGSRDADAGIGPPRGDGEAELISSATSNERRLAEALRGPVGAPVPEADAEAIAGLLRLASESPSAETLGAGLLQGFLMPDDAVHARAREVVGPAFADLYRQLALPAIAAGSAGQAEELLAGLAG